MSETRIDKDYYDSSDYFEGKAAHLLDSSSRFQRYRVSRVTEIYHPRREDRVIDIGCGWGTFSFALADEVAEVVGVDFSEKSVEICNQRLTENPKQNLRFLCTNASSTGLESETFDLAIAADIFEHLYPVDSESCAKLIMDTISLCVPSTLSRDSAFIPRENEELICVTGLAIQVFNAYLSPSV